MSVFSTPIASKAIIVERENGQRLFWFWPLAALMLACGTYILLEPHPLALMISMALGLLPLGAMVWLEVGGSQQSQALMSWHGGRLFLFEKGRHVRTLRASSIQHIEVVSGRRSILVQIHMPTELIEQKLTHIGRGQRLQIQRIVRCLQAELTYKNTLEDTPEELNAIAQEIEGR